MTPTPNDKLRAALEAIESVTSRANRDYHGHSHCAFTAHEIAASALAALPSAPVGEETVEGEEPVEVDQQKVDRALDWVDAEADKWAVEVKLPEIIKNLSAITTLSPKAPHKVRESFRARLEQNIDALVRQTFLESWLRSHESYKAHLAALPAPVPGFVMVPVDYSDLIKRLRSTLPACPYDRKSPDYWTTPNDTPCVVCGGLPDGPDKCRGADTRCMEEAADILEKLAAASPASGTGGT